MKRMILTSLALAAMISGSLANVPVDTSITPEVSGKSTRITFNDVQAGATLYIKDNGGQTLYSETIKKEGTFSKNFDLSGLPQDQYYFELEKNDAITVLPFQVESESIILSKEMTKDIVKPKLYARSDYVLLARDSDKAQSLSVDIYYEGRELIYSEKLDRDGSFLRKYDFSSSMSGEYLFYIKYDNRVFMEYVDVP